jgi:hypothetical protein
MDLPTHERVIQNRRQLFAYLNSRMLAEEELQSKEFETGILKTFVFEVDGFDPEFDSLTASSFIETIFQLRNSKRQNCTVTPLSERGFFEVAIDDSRKGTIAQVWIDTSTNPRFWLAYSLTDARLLDVWFPGAVTQNKNFDFIWLWPNFLEEVQQRGAARGFGLDYDHRKFASDQTDATSYLKMQIWGGVKTKDLYENLKLTFGDTIILSRVRMKELNGRPDNFAVQNLGYTGKFNVRGTDFSIHNATLNHVRVKYRDAIESLESCALRWINKETGGVHLEGYAIHFTPKGFELPIDIFFDHVFAGTKPFRLAGIPVRRTGHSIVADVVDMHSAGRLRFELYPDLISIYLPSGTCGNTIARFYTNLQHYFGARFQVQSDNGITFFGSDAS